MKKAGDVDDKPRTHDDAEHRRIGEQEIGRERTPILGRGDCIHRMIWPTILPEVVRLA